MDNSLELEEKLKQQAIEAAVKYYEVKHKKKKEFAPGDRISYGGRVFDEKEMINLIDSSLDFWLTTGKYTEKFEKKDRGKKKGSIKTMIPPLLAKR